MQRQKLTGAIPESFYDATTLREIDLDYNKLTGTISSSIAKLTNLVFFTASENNFDEQNLPSAIGEITSLKYLGLDSANLVGQRPDSLKDLTRMILLDLSNNELTGDLSFVAGYNKIVSLALDENDFSGTIPSELWEFEEANVINLENNNCHVICLLKCAISMLIK